MKKALYIAFIFLLSYYLIESLREYIVYNQKSITITKEIKTKNIEIETFKNIEIKKFKPIGIPYKNYSTYSPIKQFENEDIVFDQNRTTFKDIKKFHNKHYKEIVTYYEIKTNFTSFINIINHLDNKNLFHTIDKIEFKKETDNKLKCKLEYSTIIYFNIVES